MCCIRVKFELLNYGWIVGYIYIVMSIGLWAQVAVLIIDCYIGLFGTGFVQVLYLGRAPRTKETLPVFHEKCWVTRHSRIFRGLTSSQRTPGFWGVTAWYQILGIRIPRELGFGYPSPLGWFDVEYRYMKT